jgi:DNA polymerase
MNRLYIDFETKSGLSLPNVGTKRYVRTTQSDIVCLGYKLNGQPAKIWTPKLGLPKEVLMVSAIDTYVYAHNIQFDREVWNHIGVRKYRFPELKLHQCVDTMALCGRYGFPQQLDKATRVLGVGAKKKSGSLLMGKITQPPFKFTQTEYEQFLDYCQNDVEIMYRMVSRLPASHLSKHENKIWQVSVQVNQNGVPIDLPAVDRIYEAVQFYRDKYSAQVNELTFGSVPRATMTQRLKEWCQSKGVDIPDLQADTVQEYLDRDDLPQSVRQVLEIRQLTAGSAVGKYKRLANQVIGNRIYENHRYYGGRTGRYSAMGFQLHNLPRATVDDDEKYIQLFMTGMIAQRQYNPLQIAKALIRPMIKAPKGMSLIIIDYSSIENVLLAFVAGETWVLELFRAGMDEYTDFASRLYQIPYDKVTPTQRKDCKPAILGCGYGLAWRSYMEYAAGFGVKVEESEAQQTVGMYRKTHRNVVRLWHKGDEAARAALEHPNQEFKFNGCSFRTTKDRVGRLWLVLRLLSGRNIFYPKPEIIEGKFGDNVSYMGWSSQRKRWERIFFPPHKITENIIQALARDILVNGLIALQKAGKKVIAHIHDEYVVEHHTATANLDEIRSIILNLPPWAKGMPLGAEGEIRKRYHKI